MNEPSQQRPQSEGPGPGVRVGAARSSTGKRVAIGMVVLWLAVIVGLYVVIVRLKLGGAEALRASPRPPAPIAK